MDELRYRASLLPRRTIILAVIAAVLLPVMLVALRSAFSGGSAVNNDAKFRDRVKTALGSDEGKSDLQRLSGMSDADLTKELQARQAQLNTMDKAGQLETEAGEKAWGSLLRASQVQTERMRKAPKKDDP